MIGRPARFSFWLLLFALAAIARVEAQQDTPTDSRVRELRSILTSIEDADASAAALSRYDIELLGALLRGEITAGVAADGEIAAPLTTLQRDAVLAAIRRLPVATLDGWLRGRIGAGSALSDRIVAIQLARDVDHPGLLPTILDLIEPIPDVQLLRTFVADSCRDAVGGVLRTSPASLAVLAKRWDDLSPPLAVIIADAVTQAESSAALSFLASRLGGPEWRDVLVLERVHVVARRLTVLPENDALAEVRASLRSPSVSVRMEALRALGELHDVDAFQDLVRRLDDSDRRIRRVAAWSLRKITGETMTAPGDQWLDWHDAQLEWSSVSWPELRSDLRSFDEATVLAAIRGACGRRFFRDEITSEVLPLLDATSVSVRESAAALLQVLESPRALPALIRALDDREERVARVAARALRFLTKETRDLDADGWRERLNLPRRG